MKRRRRTPEQVIRKLREADRLLAEGHDVPEVAKQLEIPEATDHRWRPSTAGSRPTTSSGSRSWRLRTPRLKRIVADKELQIEALKELGRGNR